MADVQKPTREVIVHTGNIASWRKLRKKGALSPTDELVFAVQETLNNWSQKNEQVSESSVIVNDSLAQRVEPSDRLNYLFTIKVFVTRWDASLIRTAVETTLQELGITSADMIVLAFPPCTDEELTLDQLKPLWQPMEQLVQDKLSPIVGTADLFKGPLAELYQWSEVKPKVDQVNLTHCCTMPEDLRAFANENGINLYTHTDDRDILPLEKLRPLVPLLSGDGPAHWRPAWVTRYSSIVRARGIIAHKGYLTSLEKV